MGCAGQCSGSGGCGCGCAGPAARARHSSSEPVEECGSGDTPLKRVLLSARGRTAVPIEPLRHAALLPGLGEVPLRRLRDGRTVVNGPEMDRRATARHFKDPMAERGRRARLAGTLLPPAAGFGGGGSSGRDVWFGYRDTEFTVPSRWLVRYQSALARQYALGTGEDVGIASGVDRALSVLWGDVWTVVRAAAVDLAGFDSLLSCYNLPTDTMPADIDARFWHTGWGPPLQFYRWTNALIVAFSRQIEEPCTHDEHCDGFAEFVDSVLRGETSKTDGLGAGPCKLRFRMMNDDTAHAFVAGTSDSRERWICGEYAGSRTDCDEGFLMRVSGRGRVLADTGSPWSHGLPPSRFDTVANAWIARGGSTHPSGSLSAPPSSSGVVAYVYDGTWSVTLRPELLSWYGYVCDYILYLARMALDYAQDPLGAPASDRAGYRAKAAELSRYALRIMADQGRLLIHELGHVHNGSGGHCSRGNCCFDLAGHRWRCALSAILGLPMDTGTSIAADTWTNYSRTDDRTYCQPRDSTITGMPVVHCGVLEPGDSSTVWLFWCTDCAGSVGSEIHG